MTDPRADGLGVSTCIELALKNAQIEKEQVGRSVARSMVSLSGMANSRQTARCI